MAARDDFVNSIIGEGSTFSGTIELTGLLRVDGDFSGSIRRADKVLISRTGRLKSSIHSRVVVVGGAVHGDITADERVTVLSTAIVLGSIKAPILLVEEGALVHGFCYASDEIRHQEQVVGRLDVESKVNTLFTVDWQKLGNK
ncbi:polymer-forming cytoskeletal protein [Entomospira entomophila]|uniref:Polymer-forming cytoskeletal protein n=1 Tax=Entomospira entomophila TaxID=2719988 RepID=A0A968GBN4_9SPIO|nr:polymer-forming cytoskeletal protein [Entomospira entomophilus]NIZ40658.1 polymer-forming cytoskeletal protein [Entomospira entomophilus]WDI34872.1 polymer-forming cytoskeletal protein [Entomospira entomophilus]